MDNETIKENLKEKLCERHSPITYLSWAVLVFAIISAVFAQNWNMLFLSAVVLSLTLIPFVFQSWSEIKLPRGFVGALVFFIVGTLFLGEVGDFYERFPWWDTLLHTGSAIGFAMMGILLVLFLLKGDRLAAPTWLLGLMAFSFAAAIGVVWEIFEYAMDQFFGLNMQKDGLHDTMQDLIVDVGGAIIGAIAGMVYLAKGSGKFLTGTIESFVEDNPQLFDENEPAPAGN